MCGDSKGCPSNFHDCRPIWGRQHESMAGGGNGSVSGKPLGDRQFRAFAVREAMVVTGGCVHAPRASFCVLRSGTSIQDLNPEGASRFRNESKFNPGAMPIALRKVRL